jgi:hypothetical protein
MDRSEYSQKEPGPYERLLHHNAVFFRHRRTMLTIYDFIDRGLYDAAHEAWEELPQQDQIVLNRAWTKGGFFTTHERNIAVRGVDKMSGWSRRDGRVCEAVE